MSGARRAGRGAALLASACLVMSGCGSGSSGDEASSPSGSPTAAGELTVLAAASLKATFTELASTFEGAHPGTTVQLAFAGSSDLVAQFR